MNLKRVLDIYDIIKNRLPSTFPQPKLAFYQDEECLLDNTEETKKEDEVIYAVVCPDTNTINLPMNLTIEYIKENGETFTKNVPITKQTDYEIAHTLFHELAHLYFGERYGYNSKQYNDEKKCDNFANRWIRVFKKEKLL